MRNPTNVRFHRSYAGSRYVNSISRENENGFGSGLPPDAFDVSLVEIRVTTFPLAGEW